MVRLSYEGAMLELEVIDDGAPFNPLLHPRRGPPTSLEEAGIGGFGIDLIKSLMTECRYEHAAGENGFRMIHPVEQPLGGH